MLIKPVNGSLMSLYYRETERERERKPKENGAAYIA